MRALLKREPAAARAMGDYFADTPPHHQPPAHALMPLLSRFAAAQEDAKISEA